MKRLDSIWERLKNSARSPGEEQRGMTGLETAIILIAFVVVASLFALTVVSTGIFSAESGKETIHAGPKEATGSLEVKGPVVANGVVDTTLSNADSAWIGSESTISTADTTDKKEGNASADMAIQAAFTTGLAAYETLSSTVDLSSIDSVQLWVKYSTTTTSGDLELVLDDSSNCGSSLENIHLPVLVANTWKLVTVAITDNSDMTAIQCVGLNVATDDGAQTVNLDRVFGRGQATSIVITLTNALRSEPVDLSEPGDSDDDGLSDPDGKHTLIITYTDDGQVMRDLYWTRAFIGDNDGDSLLESGERVELTVHLKGLANATPVVRDTRFRLELRPEDGGVLVVERNMPDNVDAVMNLN